MCPLGSTRSGRECTELIWTIYYVYEHSIYLTIFNYGLKLARFEMGPGYMGMTSHLYMRAIYLSSALCLYFWIHACSDTSKVLKADLQIHIKSRLLGKYRFRRT